jgi:hypothetical protein
MRKTQAKKRKCGRCRASVVADADFCPDCGKLFADGVMCSRHKKSEAAGVCIICLLPFCTQCAGTVQKHCLCHDHEDYEIVEGMARVYGVSDEAAAQYVSTCLEQRGLHPFVYARKASPISVGGPDYTLFRASGEYDGHIINEIKIMVPCQEVLPAEKAIRSLKVKPGKR